VSRTKAKSAADMPDADAPTETPADATGPTDDGSSGAPQDAPQDPPAAGGLEPLKDGPESELHEPQEGSAAMSGELVVGVVWEHGEIHADGQKFKPGERISLPRAYAAAVGPAFVPDKE